MTFAEELKNISNIVTFEVNITNECALIKEKMRKAASLGIRTFQINIVNLFPKCAIGTCEEDNYYTLVIAKNIPINQYRDKIIGYLEEQGFSKHVIEVANIKNDYYCSSLISVRW